MSRTEVFITAFTPKFLVNSVEEVRIKALLHVIDSSPHLFSDRLSDWQRKRITALINMQFETDNAFISDHTSEIKADYLLSACGLCHREAEESERREMKETPSQQTYLKGWFIKNDYSVIISSPLTFQIRPPQS